MPRALWGSYGSGRSLMSEVPLYASEPKNEGSQLLDSHVVSLNPEPSSLSSGTRSLNPSGGAGPLLHTVNLNISIKSQLTRKQSSLIPYVIRMWSRITTEFRVSETSVVHCMLHVFRSKIPNPRKPNPNKQTNKQTKSKK